MVGHGDCDVMFPFLPLTGVFKGDVLFPLQLSGFKKTKIRTSSSLLQTENGN